METFKIIIVVYFIIGMLILPIYKKKAKIKSADCTDSLVSIIGDIFGQLIVIIIWPLTLPVILRNKKDIG